MIPNLRKNIYLKVFFSTNDVRQIRINTEHLTVNAYNLTFDT